ncbi:MAG: methyltransferase domain-containing protein, partial [Alphaproteobacteria bacterium]|nr:methyltransferase domain-containing protein [Alphaproteobacteria bacterium]
MANEMIETSIDGFLGGKVQLRQPIKGHRSGTDAVLLAASVPLHAPPYDRAQIGQSCLELGCGVGVTSLCLAARMETHKLDYQITGVDIQADLIALAETNAAANHISAQFMVQDISA